MMSRGTGLIAVLLAMTVGLAACNGDSSGTSASQATGVSNSSTSPTNDAAQSNSSTPTEQATASPLPCDAAATANTPCSAAHSVTRLLTKNYRGPLFQVQSASDSATQDISPSTPWSVPHGADPTLIRSANLPG